MFSTHINSPGENLALNLLVHNNADSMLSNVVHTSCFASIAFKWHSFQNCGSALNVNNIMLLIDAHVAGKRDNTIFVDGS